MRYRESSKIVRLATRDHGVQSAVAKGALRPKSRFQAALQVFSEGSVQYYARDGRELHTLTEFEVSRLRLGLTSDVGRYAGAAVLAELMIRAGSAEEHAESWHALQAGLAALESAEPDMVDSTSLAAIWSLVAAMGFAPELGSCSRDGGPTAEGEPVAFSLADGGVLCATCGAAGASTVLPPEALAELRSFVDSPAGIARLTSAHSIAHRRLLARFIEYHLAEGRNLPAVKFWSNPGKVAG